MSSEPSLKMISEICIEADAAKDDLSRLNELWNEVRVVGYKYSLVELSFIKEHITELARDLGRRDAAMMKLLLGL